MNVVHTALHPDRPDTGKTEDLAALPVAEIAAVDHAAVSLNDAVAVDRIVLKKVKFV